MGVNKIRTNFDTDFKSHINKFNTSIYNNSNSNKIETVDILDLEKGPMSHGRYDALVENLNLNSIDEVDNHLKNIIIQNPNLVYQGIERKKLVMNKDFILKQMRINYMIQKMI